MFLLPVESMERQNSIRLEDIVEEMLGSNGEICLLCLFID